MHLVFLITRSDEIGGAQVHVRDLATRLSAYGHEVSVLVGGNGIFANELRSRMIKVHSIRSLLRRISPIHDFLSAKEIRQTLKYISPDLVSLHSYKVGFLGRFSSVGLGIPVIFTAHGWSHLEGISSLKKSLSLIAERIASYFCSRVICVSNRDRDFALRNKLTSPMKLTTIKNGMPDINYSREGANPAVEPSRFLMIARFEDPKDHNLLLQAINLVNNIEITLVGEGERLIQAKRLAKKLGVEGRVTFTGRIGDPTHMYATHQAYVLISNSEGMPRSIIEAMRAGLPVIASDVGGCREEVLDGINGYLVPKGDLNTLVSRLSLVASNPALRVRMGRESRRLYETTFTFDLMFNKTIKVYEEIFGVRQRKKQT